MDIVPERQCTSCGVQYAATSKNFYYTDRSKTKLIRRCKKCRGAQRCASRRLRTSSGKVKTRFKAAPLSIKNYPPFLICKVCQIEYPFTDEFFTYANKPTGQLRTECKPCTYARTVKQHRKRREENPEKARAYRIAWNAAHPEASRNYYKAHPEARHEQRQRRRASMHNALGKHTRADILQKMKDQRGKCYWCKKKIEGKQYDVDHIFALSKGGSNNPENICISCKPCNSHKHAKEPHEFNGRLF